MPAPVVELDPLFADLADADAMIRLCERFAHYGQYTEERSEIDLGGQLQRFDSALHYVRTGGRHARNEDTRALAARTSYFRASYAYGDEVFAPGIEPFWHHEALADAARRIHGRPVIVPAIAYANVMVPGQELAVHTDVPEFRGANRKRFPQWLMVVMHHSGRFERWRLPIATGISYFGAAQGGALAYWPDGPDAPVRVHEPTHNTAIVLDTDTVFHGVDAVGPPGSPAPPIKTGAALDWIDADDTWQLRAGDGRDVARYPWGEIRFSVSWKAYCFGDDAERAAWHEHTDDLTLEQILDTLLDDLRERGVCDQRPADDADLARLLVATYIHFPA
jgi:hypothetical protein